MKRSFCSLVLSLCFFLNAFGQDNANISIQITNHKEKKISAFLLLNEITKKRKEVVFNVEGNLFVQTLQLSAPVFIEVFDGKNTWKGVIEPSDNIAISYDANHFDSTFTSKGRGSKKFMFSRYYNELSDDWIEKKVQHFQNNDDNVKAFAAFADSLENKLTIELKNLMGNCSSACYNLLKGDIKGIILRSRYTGYEKITSKSGEELLTDSSMATNEISESFKKLLQFEDNYYISPRYLYAIHYINEREYRRFERREKKKRNLFNKYDYLETRLPDNLRKPVLALHLEQDLPKATLEEDLHSVIQQNYGIHDVNDFREYVEDLYNKYRIGKKAPEVLLTDLSGKQVSFQNLKGKVVHVHFWFAGNTPCMELFTNLKQVKLHFKDNNDVVFLTVSVDNEIAWKGSVKQYRLEGYHTYTQEKGLNHPILEALHVKTFPSTYLIDKNGLFVSADPPQEPVALINLINTALDGGRLAKSGRER